MSALFNSIVSALLEKFPSISATFFQRYPLRARVTASKDWLADVAVIDNEGELDGNIPQLKGLRLPPYCKALGKDSVVRIAFDRWDSSAPYIEGIVEAITPTWRMESGAGLWEIGPDGVNLFTRGGLQIKETSYEDDSSSALEISSTMAEGATGGTIVISRTGIIAITSSGGPTVIDGVAYPPPA